MAASDVESPGAALPVYDLRPQDRHEEAQRGDRVLEVGPQQSVDQLIQLRAVPPSGHVAFSESERPAAQKPVEEPLVVDLNVVGSRTVDFDSGHGGKPSHGLF